MSEFAGFQSENALRPYPLALRVPGLPDAVLLDARLFIPGQQRRRAALSELRYESAGDRYRLALVDAANPATTLLAGWVTRRTGGISRVGTAVRLNVGAVTLLFTPGAPWDDPSFNGAGDWTLSLSPPAALEPTAVLPGPAPFTRLLVNAESLPAVAGAPVRLTGGYNAAFFVGRSPGIPGFASTALTVTLEAGSGLGAGLEPPAAPSSLPVSTINGVGPDARGNVTLSAHDCLRLSRPVVAGSPPTLLPATLELGSDCGPCCSCRDYRFVARAIARRSAKLKDLCDELADTLAEAQTTYNAAVAAINAARPPALVVREVTATANRLFFTVQNQSDIPLYGYARVSVAGASPGAFTVDAGEGAKLLTASTGSFSAAVNADRATLPALPASRSDVTGAAFPFTGSIGGSGVLRLARGTVPVPKPLPPASATTFSLTFAGISPLTSSGLSITFQSVSVQGPAKTYPCRGDVHVVTLEVDPFVPGEDGCYDAGGDSPTRLREVSG